MPRTTRTRAALACSALAVTTACSSTPAPEPVVPDGMAPAEFDTGTVAYPKNWKPLPDANVSAGEQYQGYALRRGGEVVAQMDIVAGATDVADAETFMLHIDAQRHLHFRLLRFPDRGPRKVPGATSAYYTHATYENAADGTPARSADLVGLGEDGGYLLVRVSATADAYDARLVDRILDTVIVH